MDRFLLFVALGTGIVCAQEAPGGGSVTGKVIDATTKQGIRKVTVYVTADVPMTRGANTPRQFTPPSIYSTDSDDSGSYRFPALPAGRYSLRAERIGYLTPLVASDTSVQVKAGNEVAAPDVKLVKNAAISGRITDADGEPLEHVTIQAIPLRVSRPLYQGGMAQAFSDDREEFRLARLAPGGYRLLASRMARSPQQATAQAAGQGPPQTDIPTYFPSAVTEASGAVITLGSGDERTGIEIHMQRSVAVRVSGTVTGIPADGQPAQLTLHSTSGPASPLLRAYRGPLTYGAMADADRKFVFRNVTPGEYLITGNWHAQGQPPAMANMRIRVGPQDLEDVTVALAPTIRLTGRVLSEGDTKLPMQQINISLTSADPLLPGGTGGPAKPDGTFAFDHVQRMRMAVRSIAPKGWYLKAIAVGGQRQQGMEIDLTATGEAPLDLIYSNKPGTVGGTVEGSGEGTPGGVAVAIPDIGGGTPPLTNLYKTGQVNAQDNTFKIEDIPPGNYLVAVCPPWMLEMLSETAIWEKVKSKALAAKVDENGTVRVNPRLIVESDLDEK